MLAVYIVQTSNLEQSHLVVVPNRSRAQIIQIIF